MTQVVLNIYGLSRKHEIIPMEATKAGDGYVSYKLGDGDMFHNNILFNPKNEEKELKVKGLELYKVSDDDIISTIYKL